MMRLTSREVFRQPFVFCLFVAAAVNVATARASTVTLANSSTPAFTATYKGGTVNTMTIKGRNFALYSLLNLSPVDSQGLSYAGNTQISVLTSNGNAPVVLLENLLTSNGNYYYTVKVSKSGLAKAVRKAPPKELPSLAFTATNDNPPSKGTFTMTFVVQNVGALPTGNAKNPQSTLQGLPNLTLQIGSAYFTTTNIKKNKATYP